MRRLELAGQRFGLLLALRYSHTTNGRTYWWCRCDCGRERSVMGKQLRNGDSKSCGCWEREARGASQRKYPPGVKGRLYSVWSSMRWRCKDPTAPCYKNYGARGITVCAEWEDYMVFREWALAAGYAPGLTIDRIDNDAGYRPGNCRWVSRSVNIRNRRITAPGVLAFGEEKSLMEWVADPRCRVGYSTLHSRISLGWEAEKAVVLPPTIVRGPPVARLPGVSPAGRAAQSGRPAAD
jgi:hypothetical protein